MWWRVEKGYVLFWVICVWFSVGQFELTTCIGGYLSAAIAMKARDLGVPLQAHISMVPMLDRSMKGRSYQTQDYTCNSAAGMCVCEVGMWREVRYSLLFGDEMVV